MNMIKEEMREIKKRRLLEQKKFNYVTGTPAGEKSFAESRKPNSQVWENVGPGLVPPQTKATPKVGVIPEPEEEDEEEQEIHPDTSTVDRVFHDVDAEKFKINRKYLGDSQKPILGATVHATAGDSNRPRGVATTETYNPMKFHVEEASNDNSDNFVDLGQLRRGYMKSVPPGYWELDFGSDSQLKLADTFACKSILQGRSTFAFCQTHGQLLVSDRQGIWRDQTNFDHRDGVVRSGVVGSSSINAAGAMPCKIVGVSPMALATRLEKTGRMLHGLWQLKAELSKSPQETGASRTIS